MIKLPQPAGTSSVDVRNRLLSILCQEGSKLYGVYFLDSSSARRSQVQSLYPTQCSRNGYVRYLLRTCVIISQTQDDPDPERSVAFSRNMEVGDGEPKQRTAYCRSLCDVK